MTAPTQADMLGVDGLDLFTHPATYRLILAIRGALKDAVPVGSFIAAALLWEVTFNHAKPSYLQLAATSGWLHRWVQLGAVPVPPAAVAGVLFAVGLRIGRPTHLIPRWGGSRGRRLSIWPQPSLPL